MTVTADEARRAVQYLIDSAAEFAAACADHERLDAMLKVVLAHEVEATDGPISAREHSARASGAYLAAIDARHKARLDMERMRALRHAASLKIELWRSIEASARQAERGFHSARGVA